MAAGDINDPLSDIPGITLRDNTDDPTDQGAGFALLKFKNGKLIWLPNTGSVRYALDTSSLSQLAGLTEEASPADADLLLLEVAATGAKRKVQVQNLPGGGGGGGLYDAYVCLQHQEAQNTGGGTFTAGDWRTRVLNTEVSDAAGICALSSNQATLSAGTYDVEGWSVGWGVTYHQARLRNVTAGTTLLTGSSEVSSNSQVASTKSYIFGRITVAADQALELQHRCSTTLATNGFGGPCNYTTEVYACLIFRRVAA